MLTCIKCEYPLKELPFYTDGKDDQFVPSLPFCDNPICIRYGLPTVVFKTRDEEKEDKKNSDAGVQQEPVQGD